MDLKTSLAGRLRNTNLPKSDALFPLFEAVVNSIHAIDDRIEAEESFTMEDAFIKVSFVRSSQQNTDGAQPPIMGFVIEDNGIGMNAENYDSFQLLDSTYKESKGCKGVGRLLWLKAFSNVKINSVFKNGESRQQRSFLFSTQGISEHSEESIDNAATIGTTVELCFIKKDYYDAMPKKTDTIAKKLVEHCLWYFVREGGAPRISIIDGDDASNLDYVKDEYLQDNSLSDTATVKNVVFEITHIRIKKNAELSNNICYGAASRLVLKEPLKNYIPSAGGCLKDGEDEFYYTCLITSQYLNENVSPERLQFTIEENPGSINFPDVIYMSEIRGAILPKIRDYLEPYLIVKRQQAKERIDSFVANQSPRYRSVVHRMTDEEKDIDPEISDKALELKLHDKLYQLEKETISEGYELMSHPDVDDLDDYKERLDRYMQSAAELKQSDLASYVSHRRVVIDLFEKALKRQDDDKYSKESVIHRLVMPMIKTSDEVPMDDANLWLIDERLAFHHFMASDKSLKSMPTTDSKSGKEPDLALWRFFDSSLLVHEKGIATSLPTITIVEFKRPMRDNYKEETPEDNPVKQVLRYIDLIREGKAQTDEGRPVTPMDNAPAFCYIIADLTNSLKDICESEDLKESSDRLGYYKYHSKKNAYIEVLSFDAIVQRSKERNRAFFDKLGLPAY